MLANANGYTVYWFARDPRGGSHPACAGTCLLAWFPVKGQPKPADGVTLGGKLGSITRPGAWHVIREKAPAAASAPGNGY